jgi:hypothetical protein
VRREKKVYVVMNQVFEENELPEGPLGIKRRRKGIVDLLNGNREILRRVGGRTMERKKKKREEKQTVRLEKNGRK